MNNITKLYQLNKHEPDNGIYGDCFRTAIACILGFDNPESIPLFAPVEDQKKSYVDFLDSIGYILFEIPWKVNDSIKSPLEFMEYYYPNLPYLFSGLSKRGVGHVAIYQGETLIHDTFPGGNGICSAFIDCDCFYEIGIIFKKN